jgi:hypothetical protein
MTTDTGHIHVTYSPALLLAISAVLSLVVALVVALALRFPGWRRGVVAFIVASPIPILLLAREHLPLLSWIPMASGFDFCFGEPGVLQVVSFLLPLAVGFSTLAALRARHAEVRA